jgi:hypothetical protein
MEMSTTLRDPYLLGHSIVSQQFMEPEGSIPNSQELSTCLHPEPDQYCQHRPIRTNYLHGAEHYSGGA